MVQYSTVRKETVQIHLLGNSNTIKVIKTASLIGQTIHYRGADRNIKLTMQSHTFIRSTTRT